jgi:ubiquinol oxidase
MVNTILAPDGKALAEERNAAPDVHHESAGFSDRFALGFTKLLRFTADTFFAKLGGGPADLRPEAPYPPHAGEIRVTA